jgi:hypothetical protein
MPGLHGHASLNILQGETRRQAGLSKPSSSQNRVLLTKEGRRPLARACFRLEVTQPPPASMKGRLRPVSILAISLSACPLPVLPIETWLDGNLNRIECLDGKDEIRFSSTYGPYRCQPLDLQYELVFLCTMRFIVEGRGALFMALFSLVALRWCFLVALACIAALPSMMCHASYANASRATSCDRVV